MSSYANIVFWVVMMTPESDFQASKMGFVFPSFDPSQGSSDFAIHHLIQSPPLAQRDQKLCQDGRNVTFDSWDFPKQANTPNSHKGTCYSTDKLSKKHYILADPDDNSAINAMCLPHWQK